MSTYSEYRMWYRPMYAVASSGHSAEYLGPSWKPTDHVFRGRNQAEAQRKAERFWQDAELGAGSMVCVLVGEQP